ncbi:MAG: hypothetical protein ACRC1F_00375 [Metamycoplasmataceae bacterium]
MKIKTIGLLVSSTIIPILTPAIFVSCSSTVDQAFVDKFYSDIIEKTDWKGHSNEYASSIYDLETFRAVFRDQIPTDDELRVKGFQMSLEQINPYDEVGISNYTVYLRDAKDGRTYLPTPKKISDDNDKKEPIISFSIEGFLKSTSEVTNEFDIAYSLIPESYPLNIFGKNFFQTQNIETNISFNNPSSPYYVGKLFDFRTIPGFELSGFQEVGVNNNTKTVTFRIYLKKNSKTKGPGRLVTLSL